MRKKVYFTKRQQEINRIQTQTLTAILHGQALMLARSEAVKAFGKSKVALNALGNTLQSSFDSIKDEASENRAKVKEGVTPVSKVNDQTLQTNKRAWTVSVKNAMVEMKGQFTLSFDRNGFDIVKIESAQTRADSDKKQTDTAKKDNAKAKAGQVKAEEQAKKLAGQLDSAKAQIVELKAKITTLNQTIKANADKVKKAQKHLDMADSSGRKLAEERVITAKQTGTINTLREEVKELQEAATV